MKQYKKKEAGRAAARRRANTKVEYKAARATAADARKIHHIIVVIDEIEELLRKKKWRNGLPVINPIGVEARCDAALKDLRAVSKEMEAVVRQEMKKNR